MTINKTPEKIAAQKLRTLGISAIVMPETSPYNILANGKRMAARILPRQNDGEWQLWTPRDQTSIDIYLLILTGIPGNEKMPLYLLLEAPVEPKTVRFSFSTLIRKYGDAVDNWELLTGRKTAAK